MEIKQFTDERYIPINDLMSFGDDIVNKTKEYRRFYMELIPLNDLDFVNIVETPKLVKKRYSMNVELKGHIDIEAKDNDFILKLALMIINNQKLKGLTDKEIESIIKKYQNNGNDLTIITNYLTNNTTKLIDVIDVVDISKLYPSMTKGDIKFVSDNHNIRLNYSLNDYQETNACSYETARQSLERLAALELYTKNKVGKKFVYKPTEKLKENTKGGHNGD